METAVTILEAAGIGLRYVYLCPAGAVEVADDVLGRR